MIYIFETEIKNSKSLLFSLKNVYGLGYFQAKFLCKKLGFSSNLKSSDLSNDQIIKLTKLVENSGLKITNELKKSQIFNLKMLIDIKSYSGLRRIRGLPVRGQRTHTNAKTAKHQKKFN